MIKKIEKGLIVYYVDYGSASFRNWNDGILECWNNGFWDNGLFAKPILTGKSIKEKFPSKINILIFHHSNIPRVRQKPGPK